MQALGVYFGSKLESVNNHVGIHHIIRNNENKFVNSYHNNGFTKISDMFEILAYAEDDLVIESIKHRQYPFYGIMWHPERNASFDKEDICFFRTIFGVK